jgi:peptide-methionine (R)-S-oxide reductase
MTRRTFLGRLAVLTSAPLAAGAATALGADAQELPKLKKSEEEWRRLLPRASYDVLFEEATERAGSSPLNNEHRDGTFICAACYAPLFSSDAK